jgi:hypothetical protein
MSAQNISADWAAISDEQVMAAVRMAYESQVGNVAPWVLTVVRYRAIDVARRNGATPHAKPPTSPFTPSGRPATSRNRSRHMPRRATC